MSPPILNEPDLRASSFALISNAFLYHGFDFDMCFRGYSRGPT
jgi:hypothetical protein